LHGSINLLTPGLGRDAVVCVEVLGFCRPTNALTRLQHVLLTLCSQTLLTEPPWGLPRGWDTGQASPSLPA
jgi:hypothetical protein